MRMHTKQADAMPAPYSNDFRTKIVTAYQNKEGSIRTLATRFSVNPSFVHDLLKRYRATGSVSPKQHVHRGPLPKLDEQKLEHLRALVQEHNDATLEELNTLLLQTHQIKISPTSVHRGLGKLKLTRKKKVLTALERDTERVKAMRAEYLETISVLKPEDLVFVDETGTHLGLTRLYARSLRGQRACGTVKRNRGETITTIGAVSLAGVQASFALPGGTDGAAFLVFVLQVLVPSLRPGQVVVLDNLAAHKVKGVREAIEGAGCSVVYLPPYSPELNPIEECWSKVKGSLRKVGARTREGLEEAIGEGLALVTQQDLRGWFSHSGYRMEPA